MTYQPRVLVDFDGVIHWYRHGWFDGTAYDSPMPGAREALFELADSGYEVVIFSTRDSQQIADWLIVNGFPAYRVTNIKEPCVCLIDDRAIRFVDWNQAIDDVSLHYPIKERE
jgi:hypothetical protein